MKNVLLIFLGILSLFFVTGCSQITGTNIEGKWKITESYNFPVTRETAYFTFTNGNIAVTKDGKIVQGVYAKYSLIGNKLTISDMQASSKDQDGKYISVLYFNKDVYTVVLSLNETNMTWWSSNLVRTVFEKN